MSTTDLNLKECLKDYSSQFLCIHIAQYEKASLNVQDAVAEKEEDNMSVEHHKGDTAW